MQWFDCRWRASLVAVLVALASGCGGNEEQSPVGVNMVWFDFEVEGIHRPSFLEVPR